MLIKYGGAILLSNTMNVNFRILHEYSKLKNLMLGGSETKYFDITIRCSIMRNATDNLKKKMVRIYSRKLFQNPDRRNICFYNIH